MSLVREWLRWEQWRLRWELSSWRSRWGFWSWRWRRDTAAVVDLAPGMTPEALRREVLDRLQAASAIELRHTGPGTAPLRGAALAEVKRLLTECDLLHDRISETEYTHALTEKTRQLLDYYSHPQDGELSPPESGLPPRPERWGPDPERQRCFHQGYDAGYRHGWQEALTRVAGQLTAWAGRPAQDEQRVQGLADAYNEADAAAHPPEDEDEDQEQDERDPAPPMREGARR